MTHRFITILTAICLSPPSVSAGDTATVTDSVKSPRGGVMGLYDKVTDYFAHTNDPKPQKDFDISFIGGPHYSSEAGFGLGLMAAGLYRDALAEPDAEPSNVTIYIDATTNLWFKLGVSGTHFFPRDSRRMNYDVNFASIETQFWGIGYANGIDDANRSDYKYLTSQASAEYVWRVLPKFYIGPRAEFDYINGRDFEKPGLWRGEADRTFNLGIGFTLLYDSRDNTTAATSGVYARLDQQFNPRPLFNKYAFSMTELTASAYRSLWRGGVLAANLHARFTYGDTPWGLLSTFGGSDNMRGYFEGRFRDKDEADVCVELRQRVWRRSGVVVWAGAGSVSPDFSGFRLKHLLPNFGIGYRWEFKRFINVRLDFGIGRGQSGFIFNINEAF